MNRGNMLQSSAVHDCWWRIMPAPKPSPSPPPPPSSQDIFSAASSKSHSFPNQLAPPWHQAQEFRESLSELLMGGSVSEEDKSVWNHTQQQAKKLENWEEQLLLHDPQHKSSNNVVNLMLESAAVKQENYADFYCFKPNDWPNPMIPVSSPNSCVSSLSNNMLMIANTANGRRPMPDRSSECKSSGNSGGASKKAKIQQSSSNQSTFKVRKEKLGDRITALHQIVSPFGKTDTASVLLEAIGYIRFLQTQVEALSLPYLQDSGSPNMRNRQDSLLDVSCMKMKGSALHLQDSHAKTSKDLRSRGLCLVPVSCTMQVESDNGADYWAPALNGGFRRPD